jgi:uncharacterized membrane protein YkoI
MKAIALALAASVLFCTAATCAEPERQRICFSAQETREKILTHKLTEPFRVLKATGAQMQAEAIGVKLCRWKEELVYEISLLRRDGHILHVFVNAADGHMLGSRNAQ